MRRTPWQATRPVPIWAGATILTVSILFLPLGIAVMLRDVPFPLNLSTKKVSALEEIGLRVDATRLHPLVMSSGLTLLPRACEG